MAYRQKSCENCGKQTTNPKFCNNSCAAQYNNHLLPKRQKTKKCKKCEEKIYSRYVYCEKCFSKWSENRNRDMTLQEAVDLYSHHARSSAFSLVRKRARAAAKKLGYGKCLRCGYHKHVEVAHIKAISSFDMSTRISVINHPANLMLLCPNCHWEYDNLRD